jgi:4-alpha-glucanotransferase
MPRDFFHGRHAGLLVPLFSIPSRSSWGIGEIGDLPRLGAWMANAGFSFVQLLPINEMADGQNSPYSAMSAMAIDPIFIAPSAVPEIQALGGERLLTEDDRMQLETARASRAVDYGIVRAIKIRALREGFEHFRTTEWNAGTRRAQRLKLFMDRARWWLDDYALFRALHAREDGRYWREWPEEIRDRQAAALTRARQELAGEIFFYSYLQWLAADQWADARDACEIGVFGDFPFMVSGDSADVWSRQQDFRLDASVGAPPDAFSETGQDWGFPAYRWKGIAAGGFRWLAARARRSAELYDGYRVDHLVGFFRTYVREQSGQAAFVPAEEAEQVSQGERVLEVLSATGARIIAEDLGVIPAFVRETLQRLEIPGYKVLRWEREWDAPGRPFKDPAAYPPSSVATSGTHDTETVAQWWDEADGDERRAVAAIVGSNLNPDSAFDPNVRDAIVAVLYAASSDIVLLPIHDVFGWRDRVNRPAVIDAQNWTWRLPWPVEELRREADGRERAEFAARLARQHGRLQAC